MFRRRALRRRLAAAGANQIPDDTLRRLSRALDTGPVSECVPTEHPNLKLVVTKMFRFTDLRDLNELRRLPQCREHNCCNPHHWSRLSEPDKLDVSEGKQALLENLEKLKELEQNDLLSQKKYLEEISSMTETPPPPYTPYAMDDVKTKDHGESTADARRTDHERLTAGSLATDGEERGTWETEWCRLAYWELARRVGRQFGVRVRCVDVFGGAGAGRAGLCLDALEDTTKADQVKKIRSKIGLGVTLSLESDGVWLYNRSQQPVFCSSPALDAAAARALLVWRVPPGHCLRVFDPAAPPPAVSLPHVGPVDPRSVRISFAKGWGPKYSRRDVTACPCWLEVLLAPPS